MRSIKVNKLIVFLITILVPGFLAFSGCSDKPESNAQRQLEESTQAALDKAKDSLSATASDQPEDADQFQQAKDSLAFAIKQNRMAPAVDSAIFAKGNITFAQGQKLHGLLQTKSITVTRAASQIIEINNRNDELAIQKNRLQDMVDSNTEQIKQLKRIIDGDDDTLGIRQVLGESSAKLAELGKQKNALGTRFDKAQRLANGLQNRANDKLQLAEGAIGDEKVKLSKDGLELQRKSNAAMIQAQGLGNEIEMLENTVNIGRPLNDKLQKDLNEIEEQVGSLENSSDFIKLKSQLRDVSGRLDESKNELSAAIKNLTATRSDYAKGSEEVIALLKAAIEDYEKIRTGQFKTAAVERIAVSYFGIGAVCAENITLANHAKSIIESLPTDTSGNNRIIKSCDSDKTQYGKKAFENYDLASEKYGQVNVGSEHACSIIKQQILTLNGKIEVAEAIGEYDISAETAELRKELLEKAKECDPYFSKTMTARLVDGTAGHTPVLAVDNTSYYEDIRKLYQEHAWPKLPAEEREEAVNTLMANLEKIEAEDTFNRDTYERILGPEKLKLENALEKGFEDVAVAVSTDPNYL